jgi:hypothetical protein
METEQTKFFPFGQPLMRVVQKERTPKKVFVLGVYASAVHARWIDVRGKQIVAALAVASEPEIFWTGDGAEKIIADIEVPSEVGSLVPTTDHLNGPSGRALDQRYLEPLGFKREDVWFCDLLPESRVNENQRLAITRFYKPIVEKYNLPEATIRDFNKHELDSPERREEILRELEESQASTLVLLGDLPISMFLNFHDKKYSRLADFGETGEQYGKVHEIIINDKPYKVIPLCHPRQSDRLGASNSKWGVFHDNWMKGKMAEI